MEGKLFMKNAPRILMGLIALLVLTNPSAFADIQLTGAGATFPYPIYSKWFFEYHKLHPDTQINYQSIGSGGGVRQIIARTVDFGASDAPMIDSELESAGAQILHIPTVMGAVAVTYNLPGVPSLKLTSALLADIFMGKISRWNDDRIAAINPGGTLPDKNILVVHRSDGSGTTDIFTDYLSKVSIPWASKVGRGKSVNWPAGIGAKGNEGVAGVVKQSVGAMGYNELAYAEQNHLSTASLQNKSGNFVVPSIASTSAAAAGAISKIPPDYRVSITNAAGKNSYPISGLTWLLVYQEQTDKAKGKALVDFLRWAMSDTAQNMATHLYYAALPESLLARVGRTISTIELKKD